MPAKFLNISMKAVPLKDGEFFFPYKIQKGVSAQCIALELLHNHMLPYTVVTRAIELKNKFCEVPVND